MKEQRWPGDYQTKEEEFRSARREEDQGLRGVNRSFENDYLAIPTERLDAYEIDELEPSWSSQLDGIGMQPHSREFLEKEVNCMRSWKKFEMLSGQEVNYSDGIQFSGTP